MSSIDATTPPPSNDEFQVRHDQCDDDPGEIQEHKYNPLNFHVRPSERHLWDSTGRGWLHEDAIPYEERAEMWRLYKEVSFIITRNDTVIIPDDYLIDESHVRSPFTDKYVL